MKERLQKLISGAGLASRRAAEEMIKAGRVKVNGETAVLGMSADPDTDTVTVDGKRLRQPETRVYIMLEQTPPATSPRSRTRRAAKPWPSW